MDEPKPGELEDIAMRFNSLETMMLAEIIRRLSALEKILKPSRPKCDYPGCVIIDPPNGSHGHPNWNNGTVGLALAAVAEAFLLPAKELLVE